MYSWICILVPAEPLKDIYRLVLKPVLCYLSCGLRVIVVLDDKPLPRSELQSHLEATVLIRTIGAAGIVL